MNLNNRLGERRAFVKAILTGKVDKSELRQAINRLNNPLICFVEDPSESGLYGCG